MIRLHYAGLGRDWMARLHYAGLGRDWMTRLHLPAWAACMVCLRYIQEKVEG